MQKVSRPAFAPSSVRNASSRAELVERAKVIRAERAASRSETAEKAQVVERISSVSNRVRFLEAEASRAAARLAEVQRKAEQAARVRAAPEKFVPKSSQKLGQSFSNLETPKAKHRATVPEFVDIYNDGRKKAVDFFAVTSNDNLYSRGTIYRPPRPPSVAERFKPTSEKTVEALKDDLRKLELLERESLERLEASLRVQNELKAAKTRKK